MEQIESSRDRGHHYVRSRLLRLYEDTECPKPGNTALSLFQVREAQCASGTLRVDYAVAIAVVLRSGRGIARVTHLPTSLIAYRRHEPLILARRRMHEPFKSNPRNEGVCDTQ